MNVRRATVADEEALRELWEEFEREVPEPPGTAPETWEEEWVDVRKDIDGGAVYLAEDGDGAVGVARAAAPDHGRSHLGLIHVRPRARRQGVAKALIRACVAEVKEKGAARVSLDVLTSNKNARAVWARLGFEEVALVLETPLDDLERRLTDVPVGASHGSVHVQSDDDTSVQRALSQFVPRLEAPVVGVAANGWIRIGDPLIDNDREAQARLARELAHRLGAVVVALAVEHSAVVRVRLYERGRMVDEYLSVPTFYGELPKGDELALEANPTLVARLTNADREELRRVMRTAISPADLPPADELYGTIARTMGLEP
jgi:[ribosomal protein S18]-alanine N-acetyltransferase